MRLATPMVGALATALVLTAAWAILWHHVATHHPPGLNRSLRPSLGFSAQPFSEEATATIDLDFLKDETDLPSTFSVRWNGYWFVPVERRITLQANTNSRVTVYVDGRQVLRYDAAVGQTPASSTVTLTSGAHQLVVDYEHEGGDPALSVLWGYSNVQPRPLPADSLFIRKLDRGDFYETLVVGWLGWVVVGVWLTVPMLRYWRAAPVGLKRATLPVPLSRYWRTALIGLKWATTMTVVQAVHIFALTALAVAQPLFDVVSREPPFFVARNTTTADLVALVAVVCVVLPAVLVVIEVALAQVSATAASVLHSVVVTGLGAALLMPLLKRVDGLGAAESIAVALTAAAVVALAYRRFAGVRSFVTLLSPAVIVVPFVFLLNADVRGAVIRTDELFSTARIVSAPPIVIVVFDEFPVSSLLDAKQEIDRVRYPNFARLTATATWYRNASSVSDETVWSLPSIVSGQYPVRLNAVPTRRYYPNNLFTMLSESYRMTVFGRFLQLCPSDSCTYDFEVRDSLSALVADLGIVYLHVISPDSVAAKLPPILGDWKDFTGRRRFRNEDGELRLNDRVSEFDRFLETITPDQEGRLYFLHSLSPHMPFEYVPSGHRYTAPDYQAHKEGGKQLFLESDSWLPRVLQQRHLLQVGFVDRFVGDLLDRLNTQGIYHETLLIITADHGATFQHGKPRRDFTAGTGAEVAFVPLIVKFPGQVAGIVSDLNVETIDIVPTIASVLSTTVPYDIDGRSLLDVTQPERTHKTFVRRNYRRVRVEEHSPNLYDRHVGLEEKLLGFKSGLYALGPHASLVGRPLSTLESSVGTNTLIRLDNPSQFLNVDLEKHILPLFVRGVLPNGIDERVSVAIAVNGVVVATTQSYLEHDEWVVASMIPEDALTTGANDVQVLIVNDVAEQLAMTSSMSGP